MAIINGRQIAMQTNITGLTDIDDELSTTSENPVQNKVITAKVNENSNEFYSFAYSLEYITTFAVGAYQWYPLEIQKNEKLVLKTVDGSNYANGNLLEYAARAGTQLGTISPTIDGDTATFTIDQDGVTYIRTGANFTHSQCKVFKVIEGFNAKTKVSRLVEFSNERITDIKQHFNFDFGDVNSSGNVIAYKKKMTTMDILHFDYDVIIPKRTGYTACGVVIYSDALNTSHYTVGIVNQNHDYIIKAGTFFRLVIYNPENIQVITGDKFDNIIYNDFHAFNRSFSEVFVNSGNYKSNDYFNRNIRSVCHRGASRTAPENTLPAFIEARKYGFEWVEADVARTADGEYVLLHDTTIDRTSNGTGNISELNYSDLTSLDFGSWFSPSSYVITHPYTDVRIPKLSEFLILCKKIGLRARLDFNHGFTAEQIADVCRIVVRNGMKDYTEFVGYNVAALEAVKTVIPTATLILSVTTVNATAITNAQSLKTNQNTVNLATQTINDTVVNLCANALIPLEYWVAGTSSAIKNLDPYVSVVTVEDTEAGQPLIAGYILYNSII